MNSFRISSILLALAIIHFITQAQITVSQSQFQQVFDVGRIVTLRIDTTFNRTTVNVGNRGGSNEYDFSMLKFAEWFTDTVKSISAYPYLASRYDAGGMTFRIPFGGGIEHPVIYFENSSMTMGGDFGLIHPDTLSFSHSNPHEVFVRFPVTYGDSLYQTSMVTDTVLILGSVAYSEANNISSSVVVDGWGTIKITEGLTEDCLRFRFTEHVSGTYKEFRYLTGSGRMLIVTSDISQPDEGDVVLDSPVQYVAPSVLTSVPRVSVTPDTPVLDQNYPNPFNPSTEIRFYLPERSEVRLAVFSILGQEIDELLSGRVSSGWHTLRWDASQHPAGVYFLRLETPEGVETRKIVLVR